MNILLLGGSKSGKSHLAQSLCKGLGGSLVYWATMEPTDEEDLARIRAHLQDRAGWGFSTIESGRDLPAAFPQLPPRATVLFDSATALLANEMFRPDGRIAHTAGQTAASALFALAARCENLLVVCDDLFRDGNTYDPLTEDYRRQLAFICRALAARFDAVAEVTAGIPTCLKGALPPELH